MMLCIMLYTVVLYGQDTTQASSNDKKTAIHSYFNKQTKQFNIYTGVDLAMGLGFRTQTLSYTDATALVEGSISPKIGFFPLNRWMIGVAHDIGGSMASFNSWESYTLYTRTWGGFTRYYIKGGLFGELQYGWGKGTENITKDGISNIHSFRSERYTIGLGLAGFWTKNFNFELLLRYSDAHRNTNDNRAIYQSGLSVTAGAGFSLGRNR